MKNWLPLTFVAAALLLTSCSSVRSKDGGTAPAASTGFLGMKKGEIDVDTPKAFGGVKQVVIGSFKVGFIEYKGASAKAGRGSGGRATAKTQLLGIDDAVRQQVTDAAYSDFVAMLQANGYEVADRLSFVSSGAMAKAKTYDAPYRKQESLFSSGDQMTVFTPTSFGNTMHVFINDGLGAGGFAFASATMGACNYAAESGVKVLAVNYVVDFLNAEGTGGSFSAVSTMQVGQGISVRAGSSLSLLGGQGGSFQTVNGTIRLGQPVYSTETFGEIVDTTTGTAKSLQYASNAVSALMGGGTNITRTYELKADASRYAAVSESVLKDANRKLVDTLVSKR